MTSVDKIKHLFFLVRFFNALIIFYQSFLVFTFLYFLVFPATDTAVIDGVENTEHNTETHSAKSSNIQNLAIQKFTLHELEI